jgi:hypothetical protein
MVMRKLYDGPSRRHFVTEITQRKILDLDIGGQLCTKMCMITIDHVMHVREQEDWQHKVL